MGALPDPQGPLAQRSLQGSEDTTDLPGVT